MNTTLERCAGSITRAHLAQFLDPNYPTDRHEQLFRLREARYVMYWQAIRMRGLVTQQYRNFSVGCAVFAFRGDAAVADGRWRVFWGLNTKVTPDSRPICAEPIAIHSAYAAGYTEIIGMVVVGERNEDHCSGLHPKTLHPCHECRLFMKTHPIMRPRTRILTALPPVGDPSEGDNDLPRVWELHTLNQLLHLHGEL